MKVTVLIPLSEVVNPELLNEDLYFIDPEIEVHFDSNYRTEHCEYKGYTSTFNLDSVAPAIRLWAESCEGTLLAYEMEAELECEKGIEYFHYN